MRERIKKLWGREEAPTCRLCGTPLKDGETTCSLCGYVVGAESNVFYIRGDEGGSRAEQEAGSAEAPTLVQESADPDMDDGTPPDLGAEMEKAEAAMGVQGNPGADTPVFALDPVGLRELLAEQPEMLEPGLRLVSDKNGKPIGPGFSTGVGTIDLLVRDGRGVLVVVTVAGRGQGEKLVAEMLQRVGWVRKHLGKGKQQVRGVILVEEAPKNLSYAAAAVAETIRFKTYRVAMAFENVET
ncbi:MAG: hypothetical protein ACE5IQ_06620 [Candidatus Methylomirabilales bacterium]